MAFTTGFDVVATAAALTATFCVRHAAQSLFYPASSFPRANERTNASFPPKMSERGRAIPRRRLNSLKLLMPSSPVASAAGESHHDDSASSSSRGSERVLCSRVFPHAPPVPVVLRKSPPRPSDHYIRSSIQNSLIRCRRPRFSRSFNTLSKIWVRDSLRPQQGI